MGGQVVAANSAPCIFQLATELGVETEDMETHNFALINSSNGALTQMNLVQDYVSIISLTLKLQVSMEKSYIHIVSFCNPPTLDLLFMQDKAKSSGRIGVHAVSEIAPDLAPQYLKTQGFDYVPKSVMYGYTASGYGYVHMHEFTRTSMAGKIRRFKGGYMNLWTRLSERLHVQVCCNTEVLSVKRDSSVVNIEFRSENGDVQERQFDKIIVSGAFPFNNGKTYRSPLMNTSGMCMF